MDTNSLIIMSMGVPLIAIGVPLFYLSRYLSVPEDKKKQNLRSLKVLAIVWMTVGVMIYLLAIIRAVYS